MAKRNDGKRMDGTVNGGKEVFLGCCQPVTIVHLIIRKSWCSNSGHNFRFSFYMFMDLILNPGIAILGFNLSNEEDCCQAIQGIEIGKYARNCCPISIT